MHETLGLRTKVGLHRAAVRFALTVAAIGMLAVPTATQAEPLVEPMNTGGGAMTGTLSYTVTPLPSILGTCKATTFKVNTFSAAFVLNTVISGYAGPATIENGVGTSPCESAALGGGSMELRLAGTNPTTKSTILCDRLFGWYTRVLSDLTLVLSGNCTVNQFGTGVVNFVARLQVVPMGGSGFLGPVTEATTNGVWAVAPA